MRSKNVLYYGREEPQPEQIELRAGPLRLVYHNGDLRNVTLNGRELVRRIYVAVRGENWVTIPATLSREQMDIGTDSFSISYAARHVLAELDFAWSATITGDAAGRVGFHMDGHALSTFRRNRIGICVLHPIRECAGHPCLVEHSDGATEDGAFPRHISAHQPFVNIRAISHQVVPGIEAEVRFDGDIFEMEDQRNWTDASFKTYSTPISLPYPAEVVKGTKVAQTVVVSLKGEASPPLRQRAPGRLTFSVGGPVAPFLQIGLGVASHGQPLTELEIKRLRLLHLSHLRVDLYLDSADYPAVLRRAATEAQALGEPLEVAIHLSDDAAAELESLLPVLADVQPPVMHWLVFHSRHRSTPEETVSLARQYLTSLAPQAAFGGGTDTVFVEVNRARPPLKGFDLIAYPVSPQVHAFDNLSIIENIEGQGMTMQSARRFSRQMGIVISPVSLRLNRAGEPGGKASDALPPSVDPRQMSLLGAGWTVGSVKQVAEHGAYSATYYETTGWRGVMETTAGSPLPDLFQSIPGGVFPLYHVLADAGECAGGRVVATQSSNPLVVDGLALRKRGRTHVLLANLTGTEQTVVVRDLAPKVWLRSLDESNVEKAMSEPEAFRRNKGVRTETSGGGLEVHLRPYAIVRLVG